MVAAGVDLALQDYQALAICGGLVLLASIILKLNWYDRMRDFPDGFEEAKEG